eukprot:3281329-Alexandrium_andersonii.AAC.1
MQTGIRDEEAQSARRRRYGGNVKFGVSLNNLGALPSAKSDRKSERALYVDDIVNTPATISVMLEMRAESVAQIEK